MYGTGGRIGLAVLDSDLTIEADLRRLLPEDVEIHAARVIYPHSVSAENMAIATSGLETAIESLLPVRPAAIAWACTSGSFYGGRSGHERLVETMRRKAGGVPVFTAAGSTASSPTTASRPSRPSATTPARSRTSPCRASPRPISRPSC